METKDILKKLRLDAGLTQNQVSQKSGVSYSAYQKYESGERELGANSLKKLANFYGQTTDYILCRTEKPESYYHTELENSIKNYYFSLPREVRAAILQAMVDAVMSYHQGNDSAETTQIKQTSSIQKKLARDGDPSSISDAEIEDAIRNTEDVTPDEFED